MNKEKIKVKTKPIHKKNILLTIRITSDIKDWLKEKGYSPTGIFYEAIKELGYKTKI